MRGADREHGGQVSNQPLHHAVRRGRANRDDRVGRAHDPDGTETVSGREAVTVPVDVRTHAFRGPGRDAGDPGCRWRDRVGALLCSRGYPTVEPFRRADVPERAPILAKNGTPLAEGPASARSSPISGATINVAGEFPRAPRAKLERRVPRRHAGGEERRGRRSSTRLAGRPGASCSPRATPGGGQSRVLASADPVKYAPGRTTIDPVLQEAAVTALGSALEVAVLDAETARWLGVAGIAYSRPSPRVDVQGRHDGCRARVGVVKLNDTFPVESSTLVEGRRSRTRAMRHAGARSFRASPTRATRYSRRSGRRSAMTSWWPRPSASGWNSEPTSSTPRRPPRSPPESTIPTSIGDDLDLAVSAIGQGEVLATPLSMASVSQTIAAGGMRSPNPIVSDPRLGPDAEPVRVTSGKIAATVRDLMVGVVSNGTGTAAALPGIEVAGKTGTAELGPAPASPDQGAGRAGGGRVVHLLRAGEQSQDRGGRAGREREGGRRGRGGSDRARGAVGRAAVGAGER